MLEKQPKIEDSGQEDSPQYIKYEIGFIKNELEHFVLPQSFWDKQYATIPDPSDFETAEKWVSAAKTADPSTKEERKLFDEISSLQEKDTIREYCKSHGIDFNIEQATQKAKGGYSKYKRMRGL